MTVGFTESGIVSNKEPDPERKLHIDLTFAGNDDQAMVRQPLSGKTISDFIDSKGGSHRTGKSVAGRLLEEVVELALACGLSTQEITGHIQDAIYNQCLKASKQSGHTVFPTRLIDNEPDVPGEIADVSIILKDLAHLAGVDLHSEEYRKWDKFTKKQFSVSEGGTLYAVKDHVTHATSAD